MSRLAMFGAVTLFVYVLLLAVAILVGIAEPSDAPKKPDLCHIIDARRLDSARYVRGDAYLTATCAEYRAAIEAMLANNQDAQGVVCWLLDPCSRSQRP